MKIVKLCYPEQPTIYCYILKGMEIVQHTRVEHANTNLN